MATDEPGHDVEQQLESLSIFLRWVDSELHDPSWAPTSEQVRNLHERLAEAAHAWLREVGRHP